MSEKTIEAILAALQRGCRVELHMGPDGTLKVKTVTRKDLKI